MTPRAAVSSVAASAAGRVRDVVVDQPREALGVCRAMHAVEQEEQLILALGEVADRRQQHGDVLFLLAPHDRRRMLARGGRCTQSAGQLISISRLVPQQTVQMVCPSAGHARRALR